MATSPDHPQLQFVQASGYTKGRPDGPPLWIVIHDMEAAETGTTAENTANYFATGAGGRSVSSHYCADNTSVVQCVLLKDVAWTVGNRPGNNRGINWELAGFARQTRAEWLDAFGVAMFGQIAPVIRADAAKFGIPLRRCSIADLKAFRPGVTSHNDLRLAFGVTDHTDPGPNFPWDYLMALLTGTAPAPQEDEDMSVKLIAPTAGPYKGLVFKLYPTDLGMALEQLTAELPAAVALWGEQKYVVDPFVFGRPIEEYRAQWAAMGGSGGGGDAPTHAELEQAAFEGAQRAEDE